MQLDRKKTPDLALLPCRGAVAADRERPSRADNAVRPGYGEGSLRRGPGRFVASGFAHEVDDRLSNLRGLERRQAASRYQACLQRSQPPSKIGMPVNGRLSIDLALRSRIVKSANVVAVMLGEAVGGSEPAFVGHTQPLSGSA